MTKRISLALVLAMLTFAPVATADDFGNPLAGIGEWFRGIATALAEMGGLLDPFGAPQGDEMGGEIDPFGDEMGGEIDPFGDEMGGIMDPVGAPVPASGDGEMGGIYDPWG